MPDDKGKSGMVLAVILAIIAILIFIWLFIKKAGAEPPPLPPVPECVIDADCPDGELCDNGFCVPVSPPPPPEPECVIDADCPSGEICDNGVCVPEAPPPPPPPPPATFQFILNTSDGSPIGDRRGMLIVGSWEVSVPNAITGGFINESEVITDWFPPPGNVKILKRYQGSPYNPNRDPTAPVTEELVDTVPWDRVNPIIVTVTYP